MIKKGDFVLITTNKKGVFAGTLVEHDKDKETCILENAKMCLYWSRDVNGVFGLASKGIISNCKTTPIIVEIYLNGVTSITKCTPEARKTWLKSNV